VKTTGAVLIFIAVTVCVAVVLAFPCGGLSCGLAWAALAAGLAAAVPAWRGIRPDLRRPTAWEALLLIVFGLASLRAFLWLIYPVGDEWRVLSPNNLGDLSKHIQLIRYLANGAPFWPESPFFSGASLSYYFGTDLFNSLLLCVGFSLEKSLLWCGIGGAALAAWALWRWGGAFGLAALLFNGGLAGFLVFQTGQPGDFQAELAWKNFFLSMFVTQRALLYALPATFFLLDAWRGEFFRERPGVPRWITWVIYASMPVFSLQAFAFLSLVLAAIFICRPAARKALLAFVGFAILPATVLVILVTNRFTQESGLHWHPGWMQGGEDWALWLKEKRWDDLSAPVRSLLFWAVNFGISLPLLGLLGWKAIRQRDPELVSFAGTGLLVFLVCCFFRFSPWDWDNTKFFLWAWLACAPYLWGLISARPKLARFFVCFLLFFSGAVSLVGGLDGRHGYKLVGRSELAETRAALAGVPVMARIATEPTHTNPVVLLGRPVVCGYAGMLWAHGLDYQQKLQDLKDVLAGNDPGGRKARDIGADWIFVAGRPPVKVE